ncbi:MAG: hypothetical protein VB081_10110 [Christensenella sp.]|uniref:hypothetical protein n=1 Tax=Christensenella sp. TaxID=1935934 RepID=UPI002B20372E|nr:hypothetical protein [Christensenella sp.]MEA5003840.1 hypothetical protein [Christensenella sp.]
MVKFREPTDREINTEITRLERLLRSYKMDDKTKAWVKDEINRLSGELTRRENEKEQKKADRKGKVKRSQHSA